MLVSFNPSVSNNRFKATSFGQNPYIDISKISSEAQAYHLEGVIGRIPRTQEEEEILNSRIQKCLADGQKAVVFILNRAKSKWPQIK